jgi:phosphatidylcholine synthase
MIGTRYSQQAMALEKDISTAAPFGAADRARAFAVHVFTASGAAFALLALIAASRAEWPRMFLWLAVALVIDAVDGTFARAFRVAEVLPEWSGEALDLMVDFLTYIAIPAYALTVSGLLPEAAALPLAMAIMVTSALYCADRRIKTADNYFRGFPVLWNVVAFYVFLLRPAPWLSAAAIGALVVLTFIPFPFVHPFRVRRGRAVHIGVLAIGLILAGLAIAQGLQPDRWVVVAVSLVGLYFLGAGVLRGRATQADQAPQ